MKLSRDGKVGAASALAATTLADGLTNRSLGLLVRLLLRTTRRGRRLDAPPCAKPLDTRPVPGAPQGAPKTEWDALGHPLSPESPRRVPRTTSGVHVDLVSEVARSTGLRGAALL